MKKTYLNVLQKGKYIYHWYVEDGVRKFEKVPFQPVLAWINPNAESGWKTIHNENLEVRQFNDIWDAKEFKRENRGMLPIYGDIANPYQFISFEYPNEVEPQRKGMVIFNYDIETFSEGGYEDSLTDVAYYPINGITVHEMISDSYFVFAYKDTYKAKEDNVTYRYFPDEASMLKGFVKFWCQMRPDVVTGWNIDAYDNTYTIKRITKVLGEKMAESMSPVGTITTKKVLTKFGKEITNLSWRGISSLDYMLLYQKFCRSKRERYTLEHVSQCELGQGKVDYKAEEGNLGNLYLTNFEKFVDYNIKDTELVYLLDCKLRFIDLIMSLAYMAHCNFEDAMGTVKPWDSFLYNALLLRGIMVPPVKHQDKENFPGGFVKEPVPGLYRWLSMWDIASSYPNQIRSFNISPECVVDYKDLPPELQAIADEYQVDGDQKCVDPAIIEDKILPLLLEHNLIFCCNGVFYRRDKYGFLPELVGGVFEERIKMKHRAQEILSEIKAIKDEIKGIEKELVT